MNDKRLSLCKTLGGSHAYGLNTASSDLDYRGVFINTDIAQIIGLDRFEHQDIKTETEDAFYFELRHFLCSLRKTNTMAIELLYTTDFLEASWGWTEIQAFKEDLIDSERLYKSLKGYIQGEKRLANGERQGKLGGKRREQIEKYGFSPKNFVQLLRLCWAGTQFYKTGKFPVSVAVNPSFQRYLLDIKVCPDKYTKSELNSIVAAAEAELDSAFNERTFNYRFNEKLANELILRIYLPFLNEYKT